MQDVAEAIEHGASGDEIAALADSRAYRAAHVLKAEQEHVGGCRLDRQGPAPEPARR